MRTAKEIKPIVSVVMATYNRSAYLPRAIASLLNQSFKNWELMVVDDGSTDQSLKLLNRYQQKHPQIRLLSGSHQGFALSRNRGIEASSGKYLTFLDSDDEYAQDHLERRLAYLTDHPSVDIIYGGVEVIGNPYVKDKNNLQQSIHIDQVVVGATIFGRRSHYTALDGFRDLAYSADSDFIERAQQRLTVKRVNFKTYIYHRDTPDSITNAI